MVSPFFVLNLMPWKKVKDHPNCSKPVAVVTDDAAMKLVGCHADDAAADKQIAALYANEKGTESLRFNATLEPHTTESEQFTGSEWDVTIIGAKSPDDVVTVNGRQFIKSQNGVLYSVDALKESANNGRWEDTQVFDNHLTQKEFAERQGMPRSVLKDQLGALVQTRFEEGPLPALKARLKVVETAARTKLKNFFDMGIMKNIGLSIDTFPKWGTSVRLDNKEYRVAEGFERINWVDLVGKPAAGGSLDRLVASEISEVNEMNEEQIKALIAETVEAAVPQAVQATVAALSPATEAEELEQPEAEEQEVEAEEQEETPEQPAGVQAEAEAVAQEALKRLEKLERQQRVAECQRVLDNRLVEAKLSAEFEAIARDAFGGKEFKTSELEKLVKQLKTAEAAADTTGRVTEAGGQRGEATDMITVEDKAEAEFMRLVMGQTDFRRLEQIANDNDFVKERMTEGYTAWVKDNRPPNYGQVRISEWLRTFYGDPFSGADARVSEALTTSTLSSIVKNTVNIMIAADYAKQHRWWEAIVRTEEVDTIDQATLVRLYGLDTLDVVDEGGPYTELSWVDEEETAAFVKDGNFVGVTLEAMLRDKIQAIRTLPMRLSASWYNTKSARAAAVFTVNSDAGPVLSDSGALFNATAATSAGGHANLLSAALGFTSFSAARTAMRKQTDQSLGAGRKLQLNPSYLLVPEDLETTANQIRNSEHIPGSANNDVNPFYQKFEIVTVPEWTDTNNWALVANPMTDPMIWDIVLTGNRVPSIYTAGDESSGAMFTNDTLRWKVRMLGFRFSATYDCMPVGDFRGLHKNNVT